MDSLAYEGVDPFLAPLENDSGTALTHACGLRLSGRLSGVEQSGANYCAEYALSHIANLCSTQHPEELVLTSAPPPLTRLISLRALPYVDSARSHSAYSRALG